MLEVLLSTDLNKINTKVKCPGLYAGIVYNEDGIPQNKILFKKYNNRGYNVFNNDSFLIELDGYFYISDIVCLDDLIGNFLKIYEFNLVQLYMIYKMFLNDSSFINKNLWYFGMKEVEVGYKEKREIREAMPGCLNDKVSLYYSLMNIINYKQIKREYGKKI